jgi:hypothetical protein
MYKSQTLFDLFLEATKKIEILISENTTLWDNINSEFNLKNGDDLKKNELLLKKNTTNNTIINNNKNDTNFSKNDKKNQQLSKIETTNYNFNNISKFSYNKNESIKKNLKTFRDKQKYQEPEILGFYFLFLKKNLLIIKNFIC